MSRVRVVGEGEGEGQDQGQGAGQGESNRFGMFARTPVSGSRVLATPWRTCRCRDLQCGVPVIGIMSIADIRTENGVCIYP